eukprot:m.425700 g.425700  ORF g.425700 m.425700 type:complete len:605 (-) comp54019_c0_seq1:162-1976(-)
MPNATTMASTSEVDPFTVTTGKDDVDKFKSLGFFAQIDAAVNNASKPDMAAVPLFIMMWVNWFLHLGACFAVTWYVTGAEMWSVDFNEALLTNAIAWDAIATHHGFHMCYRMLVGAPEFKVKLMVGSIKEPVFPSMMSCRRSAIDVAMHCVFDLTHAWIIMSPAPSAECGVAFFLTTAWMFIWDYGEYAGLYGMYHGPWSLFILAKFGFASPGSIVVLQFFLIMLYVNCGLGKMGPWFVAVFNQEWTLPPWCKFCDLRPHLYGPNFPRDNTPSSLGVVLGYVAASTEWIAPLLMCMTSHVVGGEAGATTIYVFVGVFTLVAMHIYINVHMPPFDTMMLNFTPMYLVLNSFYLSPHLAEPGFDYAGYEVLHPGYKFIMAYFVVYCAYGQIFPENFCYMFCYRFWAGNWPQAWVLVSASGMKKLEEHFPAQWKAGAPGQMFGTLQGPLWAFNFFGIFQTAQLPHRVLPMVMHKALVQGAALRGEAVPSSLASFQIDNGGLIAMGAFFFNWVSGYMVNDSVRGRHTMVEMQRECNFAPGEMMLVEGHSFPIFSAITGTKAHWFLIDACNGILEDGWSSVEDALAVTRPSVLEGYETRGGAPVAKKTE